MMYQWDLPADDGTEERKKILEGSDVEDLLRG